MLIKEEEQAISRSLLRHSAKEIPELFFITEECPFIPFYGVITHDILYFQHVSPYLHNKASFFTQPFRKHISSLVYSGNTIDTYNCTFDDGSTSYLTQEFFPDIPVTNNDEHYAHAICRAPENASVVTITSSIKKKVARLKISAPVSISLSPHNAVKYAVCGPSLLNWPSEKHLTEWLDYYFRNNCSFISLQTCGLSDVPTFVKPYIERGIVEINEVCSISRETIRANQLYSNNFCFRKVGKAVDWVAVIDIDEYIVANSSTSYSSHLAHYDSRVVSQILLKNQFVGPCSSSNNHFFDNFSAPDKNIFHGEMLGFSQGRHKGIYSTHFHDTVLGVHGAMRSNGRVTLEENFFFNHYYCLLRPRNIPAAR